MATARPPFAWDYELDEVDFTALLEGRRTMGRLDRDGSAVRLLEYAPSAEIRRRLSLRDLVAGWHRFSEDWDAFLADLRRIGEELALLPPPR